MEAPNCCTTNHSYMMNVCEHTILPPHKWAAFHIYFPLEQLEHNATLIKINNSARAFHMCLCSALLFPLIARRALDLSA